jgi:hypothetical protein
VDAATAAGYAAASGCVENELEGAMGYHHQNEALLDDRLEAERPEMLVYERLPDGDYRLNGVEYIVPFSAHPADREPPTVMGQALKPAPSLGIWYRHVWVWLENPSGLFADWHPGVHCPEDRSGGGGGYASDRLASPAGGRDDQDPQRPAHAGGGAGSGRSGLRSCSSTTRKPRPSNSRTWSRPSRVAARSRPRASKSAHWRSSSAVTAPARSSR